ELPVQAYVVGDVEMAAAEAREPLQWSRGPLVHDVFFDAAVRHPNEHRQALEVAVEVAAAGLSPYRPVELISAAIRAAIVLEAREDGAVSVDAEARGTRWITDVVRLPASRLDATRRNRQGKIVGI